MTKNSVTNEAFDGQYETSNSAVATITGGTIATQGLDVTRVSPAGAITGVILQKPVDQTKATYITVVNEAIAASSVTFAAAATSFVADGVGSVIAGVTAMSFVWDPSTALWYHEK